MSVRTSDWRSYRIFFQWMRLRWNICCFEFMGKCDTFIQPRNEIYKWCYCYGSYCWEWIFQSFLIKYLFTLPPTEQYKSTEQYQSATLRPEVSFNIIQLPCWKSASLKFTCWESKPMSMIIVIWWWWRLSN